MPPPAAPLAVSTPAPPIKAGGGGGPIAKSPSTALTIHADDDDEDDEAIANAVFQEKPSVGVDNPMATGLDGLLCCLRSRCLTGTCVLFPCLLLLLLAWWLPSATLANQRRRRVLVILAMVPPGLYVLGGLAAVVLVCVRQIGADRVNAAAAHRYLRARAQLQKIAVTTGGRTTMTTASTTEVTVAGRVALFHRAARDGDTETCRWCLENGQDIDQVDHLGRAAVHWAAMHGMDEILSLLLRNGASVDLQDHLEGLTPLHYAAYYGHIKLTRVLVNAGADLTRQDHRKLTPLQLAEMASLRLVSVQPSHQMIIKFLRIAMKDAATPPLQHLTGLTVTNLVERQMMAQ